MTSRGNLISANQYFASKIWTRHSKYKAMRAGPHSTPNPSPSEGLLAGYVNSDLAAVHDWLKTNKLSCNTSKTSYMTIGCSRQNLTKAKFMNLGMDDRPIEHKPSTKLLGVHIDEMLTCSTRQKS